LEQGVLSGRYTPSNPPANANSQTLAQIAMVEKLRPLAKTIGRPLSHIALSWLLSRPGVAAVIPGASRVDQLEDNCGVADWNLSADEMYEIDRVLAAPAAG
jgi:aryl-alcohol dehydrogenase-like predicted oxidoreductase